jgi:hypothetical protein
MRNSPRRLLLPIALIPLLLTTLACTATRPEPPVERGSIIRGTVRLRPGMPPPANVDLYVIARSSGGHIYTIRLAPRRQWPVAFELPVQELPDDRGKAIGFFMVNARAEAEGRTVLVTESNVFVDGPGAKNARPIEIVLHPAIE